MKLQQCLLTIISATTPVTLQAFRSYLPSPSRFGHRIMAETNEVAVCTPGGKCIPCETLDKSHLLSAEQIQAELTCMKLWRLRDGNKISRSYTTRNFQVSRFTGFVSITELPTDYWSCIRRFLFFSVPWTVLWPLEELPRERITTQTCI